MASTWRKLISEEMTTNGESWEEIRYGVIGVTRMEWEDRIYPRRWVSTDNLSHPAWDVEFDAGYGGTEGAPFTVWTDGFVYFPVQYDGSEWASSVPRHPRDLTCNHVGGG